MVFKIRFIDQSESQESVNQSGAFENQTNLFHFRIAASCLASSEVRSPFRRTFNFKDVISSNFIQSISDTDFEKGFMDFKIKKHVISKIQTHDLTNLNQFLSIK